MIRIMFFFDVGIIGNVNLYKNVSLNLRNEI